MKTNSPTVGNDVGRSGDFGSIKLEEEDTGLMITASSSDSPNNIPLSSQLSHISLGPPLPLNGQGTGLIRDARSLSPADLNRPCGYCRRSISSSDCFDPGSSPFSSSQTPEPLHMSTFCSCHLRAILDSTAVTRVNQSIGDIVQLQRCLATAMVSVSVTKAIYSLRDRDAMDFMDILHMMLENLYQDHGSLRKKCRRMIRKLSIKSGTLPRSLFLSGIQKDGDLPVSGGGFADIYSGTHMGRKLALKVLRVFTTEREKERVQREFCREAVFWQQLEHRHILPFLGVSNDAFAGRLSLVSEWMHNGNISQYIDSNPYANRITLLRQAAEGLDYLHSLDPCLIHGDIKGANILINNSGEACLSDFGLVMMAESQLLDTTQSNKAAGSMRWLAPELLQDDAFKNRQSDVYAYGMTCYEVQTGRIPFHDIRLDAKFIFEILRSSRPQSLSVDAARSVADEKLWALIERCWSQSPLDRPPIHVVVSELLSIETSNSSESPLEETCLVGTQVPSRSTSFMSESTTCLSLISERPTQHASISHSIIHPDVANDGLGHSPALETLKTEELPTSTSLSRQTSIIPDLAPIVKYTDDFVKETHYLRRRCTNCRTTEAPSWRSSLLHVGKIVCNKCGLYERKRPRSRASSRPQSQQDHAEYISARKKARFRSNLEDSSRLTATKKLSNDYNPNNAALSNYSLQSQERRRLDESDDEMDLFAYESS